jgi:methionine synthase I (cobalamin-dependent)
VLTYSFDTAGRTIMGLLPSAAAASAAGLAVPPLAIGANCGVGAPALAELRVAGLLATRSPRLEQAIQILSDAVKLVD